ncbi:MAG: hypothetical protein BYD32DRAFT_425235, partial [Podila humilis]
VIAHCALLALSLSRCRQERTNNGLVHPALCSTTGRTSKSSHVGFASKQAHISKSTHPHLLMQRQREKRKYSLVSTKMLGVCIYT